MGSTTFQDLKRIGKRKEGLNGASVNQRSNQDTSRRLDSIRQDGIAAN